MFELVIFILIMLWFNLNYEFININEEFNICISLILSFIISFNLLRKSVILYFYNESKIIYLIYYYSILSNNKLINNLSSMFCLLNIKIIHNLISEFLIVMIILYSKGLNKYKYKYIFIFKSWILSWLYQLQNLVNLKMKWSFVFLLNLTYTLIFSGMYYKIHIDNNYYNNLC